MLYRVFSGCLYAGYTTCGVGPFEVCSHGVTSTSLLQWDSQNVLFFALQAFLSSVKFSFMDLSSLFVLNAVNSFTVDYGNKHVPFLPFLPTRWTTVLHFVGQFFVSF